MALGRLGGMDMTIDHQVDSGDFPQVRSCGFIAGKGQIVVRQPEHVVMTIGIDALGNGGPIRGRPDEKPSGRRPLAKPPDALTIEEPNDPGGIQHGQRHIAGKACLVLVVIADQHPGDMLTK